MSKEADIDLATYVEQTDPADALYNQGLANLNAGRLKEASRKFDAVDRQHPYSEFARKSMVMGAFANYRQGNYDEAINAAKRYVALYPSSRRRRLCAVHRRPQLFPADPRRDAGPEGIAPRHRGDGGGRSSAGPNPNMSRTRRRRCALRATSSPARKCRSAATISSAASIIAAAKRFRYVVENYSNTRHVEEALARLTETYYAMGLTSEAQTAAAVLGHNYPDSQWYKDSYALLQTGGLEPRENSGSWISQGRKAVRRRLTTTASSRCFPDCRSAISS